MAEELPTITCYRTKSTWDYNDKYVGRLHGWSEAGENTIAIVELKSGQIVFLPSNYFKFEVNRA